MYCLALPGVAATELAVLPVQGGVWVWTASRSSPPPASWHLGMLMQLLLGLVPLVVMVVASSWWVRWRTWCIFTASLLVWAPGIGQGECPCLFLDVAHPKRIG